jgi:response regulator RpfG family c-di-GMP phosphodiesterase
VDGEAPLSDKEVYELIAASSNYYFDPEISRVLLENYDELLSLREALSDPTSPRN